MTKNQARVIILLSITVFILTFMITGRVWFRLDFTRNKAYTISDASRNLYREISDQVRITYFISDKLRQTHPIPGEIADLVREYSAHSRGKIRFIQKDPAKAELIREIEQLGIVPQQIQVAEKDEITVATVYSGLLIEYLDRESVIPVIFSLDTLEYDLSSRIRSLVRNTERSLGVIVGDANKQLYGEYNLLYRELLLSGFKVREIGQDEDIPAALPSLIVLGGAEDIGEGQLARIDRYILGGGNVFFAVDGIMVNSRSDLEARAVTDQGLLAMLANYGVVVLRAMVLDRTALNLTFQTQNRGGTFIQTLRYPHWISVQNGNSSHSVTARFQGLDLYWASPLQLSPPSGVQAEVLFGTSEHAWLQTERFVTNPNLLNMFGEEMEKTRGGKILGVSLSGIFPGAFEEPSSGDIPQRRNPSRIIVVGDADFAGSLMQANRGEGRNLDFLVKAVEWLSNDDDIVAIRGREGPPSRLDRITDPDKRSAAMLFSRTINTVVVPLFVIILGLFIVLGRKAKTSKGRGETGDV